MQNVDLRIDIKNAGIRYWQIADRLGLNDGNFSRKLRKELTITEKNRIREIIDELKVEAEYDG